MQHTFCLERVLPNNSSDGIRKRMSNRDSGREAVELIASTYVLCIGLIVSCFFIFGFAADPFLPTVYCVGGFSGFMFLSWLLRDKKPGSAATFGLRHWLAARKPEKPFDYKPRRRGRSSSSEQARSHPPSAEDVREMKEESVQRTWVPSQSNRKQG